MVLTLLEGIEGAAELPLRIVKQLFVSRWIIVPVEYDTCSVEAERLERLPVLEKSGMGEAEHPAGILVSGHHSHSAVTVTPLGTVRKHGGGKCGIPDFPPPVPDDVQKCCNKTK